MNTFSTEEEVLFDLLSSALAQTDFEPGIREKNLDWQALIQLAAHHAVLPILYHQLKKFPMDAECRRITELTIKNTATEFYQILFIARNTIEVLSRGGVPSILLKGATVARFYPIPESRKSSDIDLLLANPKDLEKASALLNAAGYRCMEHDHVLHHQAWGTPDNHLLELHLILVEPFDDHRINQYIQKLYTLDSGKISYETILGITLPVLPDDLLGFHLLLHMLQDFLRRGFGLKLLCDWVVFWNREVSSNTVERFLGYVTHCGLTGFLAAVTTACIHKLGLITDQKDSAFTLRGQRLFYRKKLFCVLVSSQLEYDFLKEVVDAERYGKPSADRMVAMRGSGPLALFREFHHQTQLSFPKGSRIFFLLPVLYGIVLFRFLYNNRTLRKQSASSIIHTARKRSQLVRKINKLSHEASGKRKW